MLLKKVHFYISCCMERLWSCGWKSWGTGSFKALKNAVLACLEHVITFLCLAKNFHIILKSETTRKQAPQKKKRKQKNAIQFAARYCWAVWWRAYAKNLWSSEVCAMKTWTWMQFPFIGQEALCPAKHNLQSHMLLNLSEKQIMQIQI